MRARLAALVLGLVFACAPDVEPWLRTPKTRAKLFLGLRSYSSPAAVKRSLQPRYWKVRSKKGGRSRGCLSRSFTFEVQHVRVLYVEHLGSGGRLDLTFLNNKLVRTEFWPEDGEKYLRKLLQRRLLILKTAEIPDKATYGGASPHARVTSTIKKKRLRVTWVDTRLIKAYWEVQSRGSSRYMK